MTGKLIIGYLGLIALLLSCADRQSSSDQESDAFDTTQINDLGRKISTLAQATLLSHLGKAISEQDAAYAVRFCNLSASAMIDSINQADNCNVQRVTTRWRNPANKVETSLDKVAWNTFRSDDKQVDTVLVASSTPVYYKPIFIASELCLQCHGSRSTDIELATLETIDSLYPADAAVNYRIGDLRGMWKISVGEGQ